MISWVIHQAVPKFMAPIHSGLTLTAAEGESSRCLARRDFGGGAGSMAFMAVIFHKLICVDMCRYVYSSAQNGGRMV